MPENYYPFDLVPLPYAYDALEPFINRQTMQVHHDKLLKAYVDKLNTAVSACPRMQNFSLPYMLSHLCTIPPAYRTQVRRLGGGVWNHNFFFQSLHAENSQNKPTGNLADAIAQEFASCENFKKIFKERAMAVFGSGWLWLVQNCRGNLSLVQTANQDSPISSGLRPLIVIDIWEHAYFLQYLNRRDEYIENWFHVIDWQKANQAYGRSRK
jgi:Fe-Mn family superoxide dismutase